MKTPLLVSRTIGLFLLTFAIPQLTLAEDAFDAVRDKGAGPVVNSFNDCVRTKWSSATDPCGTAKAAPAPKPIAAPIPSKPRASIAQAERTVYFEFNASGLTSESKETLDSLAEKLKSDSQVREARVVGYADRIGSDEANQRLSEKRAAAVRDYLIAHGFAKIGTTETRWLGESVPATECEEKLKRNELIECLAKDRRVEVEIDYTTQE